VNASIVFVSHFRVHPGASEALDRNWTQVVSGIRSDKPGTLAFLGYRSEDGGAMTAVHVFADPAAMAAHFEGAEERSRLADAVMTPAGWEVYGAAPPELSHQLRAAAAAARVPIVIDPEPLAGFVRLAAVSHGDG